MIKRVMQKSPGRRVLEFNPPGSIAEIDGGHVRGSRRRQILRKFEPASDWLGTGGAKF
jgi:hypothetical protein